MIVFNTKFKQIRNSLTGFMSSGSKKFKIGNFIVRFYAIFMMDTFKWEKFSSNMFFHYFPMFQNMYSVFSTTNISSFVFSESFEKWVVFSNKILESAFVGTKTIFHSFPMPIFSINFLFTIFARIVSSFSMFFRTTIFAKVSNVPFCFKKCVKNNSAFSTYSRICFSCPMFITEFYYIFECHILSPFQKVSRAVVTKMQRHFEPLGINRNAFAQFGYKLSITLNGGYCNG